MNALIVGKRRMGKSTLALALSRLHANIIIVYDPNTQFREFGEARTIPQIQATLEWFSDPENPEPEQPVILVFRPRVDHFDEDFTALADMLWRFDGYTILVDEASTLQTPHQINPSLARIVRQGPAGVSIIQTCHRVPDINRLGRALCTDYFFFRSTQSKDVANMAAEFDDRLDHILPMLKAYEVVHHWAGSGGVDELSIWRDSKPWFIELGHGEHEYTRETEADEDPEPQGSFIQMPDTTTPVEKDKVYTSLKAGA